MTFNGFISYSHAADGRLAPAVQRGLHRLARPWHRRRALWIFRDQTGLSVTPALWSSIQTALDGSDYFVLLASPEAARSQWVNREIEHWMATKSADHILPVVTDGEWEWDPGAHDFTEESTAVPAALRGVFAEEPLYLDLRWARGSEHLSLQHSRFRDAIAQLAAPMHGVSKDELEGEDVRQHRKARRMRSGAVATLLVLALIAGLTGVSAVRNAEKARDAAAEALRQRQVADVQRGSAERSAEEAARQQELAAQQQSLAQQQQARATDASDAAEEAERVARKQQELADKAGTEARRQQKLADEAAARTRKEKKAAKEAAKRAQQLEQEAERLEAEARRLKAEAERLRKEAERLRKIAAEQQRLAREATAEAKRQQAKADQQQRIAVSRRLINQARAAAAQDPRTALMLGSAAHRIQPDTETRSELAGVLTSTPFAGTIADVTRAEYLRDGTLATRGTDGRISFWNVADRTHPVKMSVLPELDRGSRALTFSPDGRTLAVRNADGDADLWDVTDRTRPVKLSTLADDNGGVMQLAFGGNKVIATALGHGDTLLWDISDRTRPVKRGRMTQGGHYTAINMAFSPDGGSLIVDKFRFLPVWDTTDLDDPVDVAGVYGLLEMNSMAYGPAGQILAVGLKDVIYFYDMEGRKDIPPPVPVPTQPMDPSRDPSLPQPPPMPPIENDLDQPYDGLRGLKGDVNGLTFSPDGRYIAFSDDDGVQVRERASGDFGTVNRFKPTGAGSLAFSPDGETLVTVDATATATLWDVTPRGAPDRLVALPGPDGDPLATTFSTDGRSLVAAGSAGTAKSWTVTDPARPAPDADLTVHTGGTSAVAFSPDGRLTAAAGRDDHLLTLTDRTRPGRPVTLTAPASDVGAIGAMTFSPDGRTVVAVTSTNRMLLWDVTDQAQPVLLTIFAGGVNLGRAAAFSPDGRTLATGGADRALTLWNVANRAAPVRLASLTGHSGDVTAVAFSQDGRTLASGSTDLSAMLWDVRNAARPFRYATLTGHVGTVTEVKFSPDNRTLAVGELNNAASLWDIANLTGPVRLVVVGAGLNGGVKSVAFRSDGRTLAVTAQRANNDKTSVSLWNYTKLNTIRTDPAKQACAIVGRGLNADEWDRYVPEFTYERSCPK
jgi:WD40 repeat protein